MRTIAALMDKVIANPKDGKTANGVVKEVKKLAKKFPLYSELLKR